MEIFQIVGLGIVASIAYIILKETNQSFAFFIILVTSLFIFVLVLTKVSEVILFIEEVGSHANVDSVYLKTILKIIGIAYLVELGVHITNDAGLSSVSKKIELAGKITILLLALPILQAVIRMILNFLPMNL